MSVLFPRSTNELEILQRTSELAFNSLTILVFVLMPRLAVLRILLNIFPQLARSDPRCGVPKNAIPRTFAKREENRPSS